jgi:hypothetical protein
MDSQEPRKPPRLRLQAARFGPMCKACAHFDPEKRFEAPEFFYPWRFYCKKFDAQVRANEQCDEFYSRFDKARAEGRMEPDFLV